MKYGKDDYRSHKPGEVLSVGPIYLTDRVRKDTDGELIRIPNMYAASPGPNRKARRSLDAMYRREYGKLAFEKLIAERKGKKAANVIIDR